MKRNISAREMEYKLYKESVILQTAFLNADNFNKSVKLQKKQDEVYKKWKFYKQLRKEMEKKND